MRCQLDSINIIFHISTRHILGWENFWKQEALSKRVNDVMKLSWLQNQRCGHHNLQACSTFLFVAPKPRPMLPPLLSWRTPIGLDISQRAGNNSDGSSLRWMCKNSRLETSAIQLHTQHFIECIGNTDMQSKHSVAIVSGCKSQSNNTLLKHSSRRVTLHRSLSFGK